MVKDKIIKSPFLKTGFDKNKMMLSMLVFLTITALTFSLRYDFQFIIRYVSYLFCAGLIEIFYYLLKDNSFKLPSFSTLVTTSLLILSVPAKMGVFAMISGILVALFFGKFLIIKQSLRLNPMLLGRLFMMLLFTDSIQKWELFKAVDSMTQATILDLHYSQGEIYNLVKIFTGTLQGNWEGFIHIVPGSPGEFMPLLTIVFGLILYFKGVLDWRPGTFFIIGFIFVCWFLNMPVMFHLLSGAVVFTAVYIISDPSTVPGSKFGRILSGLIAGSLNAIVRYYEYYPEGIVISVLAVNLLTPTLDNLSFFVRSYRLKRVRLKNKAFIS